MEVNAINSLSGINFGSKNKNKKNTVQKEPPVENIPASKGFMSNMKGPVLMAMFLPAVAMGPAGCQKIDVSASAKSYVVVNGNDTIKNAVEFPWELADSINRYASDVLDLPISGEVEGAPQKVLTYIEGARNWDYDRPENYRLNPSLSNKDELHYDHVIADSIMNDVKYTLVRPGDLKIVRKDGSITSDVSGLLQNEDGVKTFIHSNGKSGKDGGKLHIYQKAMSGPYQGKFVERGTIEPGILYNFVNAVIDSAGNLAGYDDKQILSEEIGENILLNGMIYPGDDENPPTQDSWIKVKGNSSAREIFENQLENENM